MPTSFMLRPDTPVSSSSSLAAVVSIVSPFSAKPPGRASCPMQGWFFLHMSKTSGDEPSSCVLNMTTSAVSDGCGYMLASYCARNSASVRPLASLMSCILLVSMPLFTAQYTYRLYLWLSPQGISPCSSPACPSRSLRYPR